jgi:threonine dehydrogenase-like Zn-dependent dehydrogenase
MSAPTSSGRLAYMVEPGRLELREYPFPELGDGALLVRTLAAGVCGSELHMFAGRHPLQSMVMGHEIVAEVTEHGNRTHDSAGVLLAAGDRVSIVYYLTCDACPACARGEFELCWNAYRNWSQSPDVHPHFTGTHATHYYVDPKQWLFRVPDNVPDLIAASANCGLSQVWAGIERAAIRAGERIVIQGAGGLGLYATAIAKERGATVIVVDSVDSRLRSAAAFGADAVISMEELPTVDARIARVQELTDGEGADVGFEVAGVPAAVSEGIELVRPGGRYIEIGNVTPGPEIALDIGRLTRRSVSIIPVIRYKPWILREALAFLSRNVDRLPLDRVVDRAYPLEGLEDALRDAEARRVTRPVVTFGHTTATST